MEENNNVIQFPERRLAVVNGAAVDLGRMSLADLLHVQAGCQAQLEAAEGDLAIVQDYLGRWSPDGNDVA